MRLMANYCEELVGWFNLAQERLKKIRLDLNYPRFGWHRDWRVKHDEWLTKLMQYATFVDFSAL
jgi:hypothetical protein